MTCEHYEKNKYVYHFTCEACKTRFIQNEPCKYLRKVLVETYSPKYGDFQGWKEGATCGCDRVCKRKAAIKKPDEQQTYTVGTKTSRRR